MDLVEHRQRALTEADYKRMKHSLQWSEILWLFRQDTAARLKLRTALLKMWVECEELAESMLSFDGAVPSRAAIRAEAERLFQEQGYPPPYWLKRLNCERCGDVPCPTNWKQSDVCPWCNTWRPKFMEDVLCGEAQKMLEEYELLATRFATYSTAIKGM
jgi:hypothetical protein